MKFIHITDTHLVSPGTLLHGLDPAERFSRCVDDIRRHHGDAECCVITGALAFAIIWLLTTALALGDASLVVPLTNMGFVAAFVLSVLLKLEKLTARKTLAIATAVLAIVLLTHEI